MAKIIAQHSIVVLLRLLTVFVIYFLCRILFFVINQSMFEGVDLITLLFYCIYGLKFDLSAIVYLNLIYIAMSLHPFRFRTNPNYKKTSFWVFIIINSVGIVSNTIGFAYFPYILQRSTFTIFDFIGTESNIFGLVPTLAFEFWYVPILTVLLLYFFVFLNSKIDSKSDIFPESNIKFYTTSVFVFLLTFVLAFVGIRGGVDSKVRPIGILQAGKYVRTPIETAIILNTPFSIIRTINKQKLDKLDFFSEEELSGIFSPRHFSKKKSETKDNVVIIILESFGKEYSGYLNPLLENGEYNGYMPFLDSLMQESLVFPNAYANGRISMAAVPSIISSIPSFETLYSKSLYTNNKIHSIPNLLNKQGYTTAFYHGAENGSMNFESFTKLAGYDAYYGKNNFVEKNEFDGNIWGVYDEPFYQYFAKGLNEMKEPFLGTIFSLSSHTPFVVPDPHKGEFAKGNLGIHKMIGYGDFSLKQFFKTAQRMSWFKNTVFVITADHCSQAYHKKYKTSGNIFSIPIILYKPNSTLKGIDSTYVQQLDIMPTLINYIGIEEDYYAFGTDMLDTSMEHFAVNYLNGNYQLIKDGFLLQYNNEEGVVGFFNLKTDQLQKDNLKGILDEKQEVLLRFLKVFLQQHRNRMIENRFCSETNPLTN